MFSIDFMISLMIFTPLLILTSFLWNYSSNQFQETEIIMDMRETVVLLSDLLIKSHEGLGLAVSNNRISQEKLNQLSSISCLEFKEFFDINYNFYLEVKDLDEIVLFSDTKCGNYSNSGKVMPIKRFVLLDGKPVVLTVILWE